jgi:hypothetical protein
MGGDCRFIAGSHDGTSQIIANLKDSNRVFRSSHCFPNKSCGSTIHYARWSGTLENRAMTVRRRSFRPLVWTSELEGRVVLSSYAVKVSESIADITAHIREASRLPNARHRQIESSSASAGSTAIHFADGTYLLCQDLGGQLWTPQTGETPPNGALVGLTFKSDALAQGVWSHGRMHGVRYWGPQPIGEL